MAAKISVGIGSWTDKEYKGILYPRGLPDNQRLATYATHFGHVELNMSYHRIPPVAMVEGWVQQTPHGFLFDYKLPRDVAANPERAAQGKVLDQVLRSAQPLIDAGKLGAFFLVLPPTFSPDKHRIEELDALAEKLSPHLLAVELRHNAWVAGDQRERTLDYFRAKQLVWIAVDMPQVPGSTLMPAVDEVTNPKLAYLRLHGRRTDWEDLKTAEEKHGYQYSEVELKELAARVRQLAKKADAVHVVCNTHAQDFAPKAALALSQLLGISS